MSWWIIFRIWDTHTFFDPQIDGGSTPPALVRRWQLRVPRRRWDCAFASSTARLVHPGRPGPKLTNCGSWIIFQATNSCVPYGLFMFAAFCVGSFLPTLLFRFVYFSLSMSNVQPLVNKHAVLEALLVSWLCKALGYFWNIGTSLANL